MTVADLITDRVDSTCDAFETLWNSGDTPRVEQFLPPRSDPEFHVMLVELLGLELDFRRLRGETPEFGEFARRFPSDLLLLAEFDLGPVRLDQSVDPAVPAARVANFRLEEQLGTGTYGTVWRAWDSQLERTVALKLPRFGFAPEDDLARFLKEARAVAALNHPNIVSLHAAGCDAGKVYLAFEYIDGADLRKWLRDNRIEPVRAAQLCGQIADALEHAHRRGIIHRDLKPANILIDRVGEPHVTDFGLAKRLAAADSTASGAHVLGTPVYMSPEQADGNSKHVDARTDVYSLGVILYELLTGRVPFEGDQAAVFRGVLTGDAVPPRQLRPEIPRDLETVCRKAMARDRDDRYGTVAELAADLRRAAGSQPILGKPPRRISSGGIWSRRRFAGLALATLPVLGYAMWTGGPRREGRRVRMTTDPVGASLYFIPLNPATEVPEPDRIIHVGISPVETYLPPGDYLVEAVLDHERFHEAIRNVPEPGVTIPPAGAHRASPLMADGVIMIPRIHIRPLSDFQHMARVEGSHHFEMGVPGSTIVPRHVRSVPPFLMSPVEFTWGNYRAFNGGRLHRPLVEEEHPNDCAMEIQFDGAVGMAERSGGRLPHEAEWEFAATLGGTLPIGSAFPQNQNEDERFGPVGAPGDNDRIDLDRRVPIFGLRSNVAEWTINRMSIYPMSGLSGVTLIEAKGDHRIVRGGSFRIENHNAFPLNVPCDPRERQSMFRYETARGLGFRYVRSVAPRLTSKDFVQIVEPAAPIDSRKLRSDLRSEG